MDGIIFSRVSDRSRVIEFAEHSNIPVVILDRSLKRENIPTVVLDNPGAGAMAAEHLIRLGHREIGVVTGPLDIALCRERQRGFVAALERHGLHLPASRVFEGDSGPREGGPRRRPSSRAGCPSPPSGATTI